jgi:hypothetical protein
MNAVMVVAKNPSLLRQTTEWVERLDRSDNSGTTLRSYRLQYGNATMRMLSAEAAPPYKDGGSASGHTI